MPANLTFPYETRLNVLHGPLEIIDEKAQLLIDLEDRTIGLAQRHAS